MSGRQKFDKTRLDIVLEKISTSLDCEIELYLIGGLAMIKHGSKASTKDIDVVFKTIKEIDIFIQSAEKHGFRRIDPTEEEYIDLNARIVLEGPDGIRFDVFYNIVCSGLEYSSTMEKRAKNIEYHGKLRVHVSSIEDIFLFKSITTRPDDLADMATLARAKIDWNIVEKEVRTQKDSWKWIARLYGRLLDLEDEFEARSPLTTKLAEEAEVFMAIGIIMDRLERGAMPIEELSALLGDEEKEFVKKVLAEIISKGLVEDRDGFLYRLDS